MEHSPKFSPRNRFARGAGLTLLLALLYPHSGVACAWGDVWCLLSAQYERSGAIKSTLGAVYNDVNTVETGVKNIAVVTDQTAKNLAGHTFDVLLITEDVFARFSGAAAVVKQVLELEALRYGAFVADQGSICSDFQSDLVTTLTNLEGLANRTSQVFATFTALGGGEPLGLIPRVDASGLVQLFDDLEPGARCTLLFPLHELLTVLSADGECPPDHPSCLKGLAAVDELVGRAKDGLDQLDAMLESAESNGAALDTRRLGSRRALAFGPEFYPPLGGSPTTGQDGLCLAFAGNWSVSSWIGRVLILLGKGVPGLVMTGVGIDLVKVDGANVGAALGVEADVEVKADLTDALLKIAGGVGSMVEMLGNLELSYVSFCRVNLNQQLILCRQENGTAFDCMNDIIVNKTHYGF